MLSLVDHAADYVKSDDAKSQLSNDCKPHQYSHFFSPIFEYFCVCVCDVCAAVTNFRTIFVSLSPEHFFFCSHICTRKPNCRGAIERISSPQPKLISYVEELLSKWAQMKYTTAHWFKFYCRDHERNIWHTLPYNIASDTD